MKKIPTLLALVPDDKGNRVISNDLHPQVAELPNLDTLYPTRKVDGTAAVVLNGEWYLRRMVRKGRRAPEGFVLIETDPNTGHSFGWEPKASSSFGKLVDEALAAANPAPVEGTWELIGPKINGNPEKVDGHRLVAHGGVKVFDDVPSIREILATEDRIGLLAPHFDAFLARGVEGVVWWSGHHPVAKLRVKDFRPELDSRFRR